MPTSTRQPGQQIVDLFVDVAKEWFIEWWWKAVGWDYPLPTEVAGHDGFGETEAVDLSLGAAA